MKVLVNKVKKDEVNENVILQQFPQSFNMGLSVLQLKVDEFIQYTVCSKCDSVYELAACSEKDLLKDLFYMVHC